MHHIRHAKPYRCTNASCPRKEGFSTVRDLNRHLQTKHPDDLSNVIQSQAYHCLVFGCKFHDKIWPRQDNFRSHLKRMHRLPDGAMDFFIREGRITGSQNSLDAGGMTQGIAPSPIDSEPNPLNSSSVNISWDSLGPYSAWEISLNGQQVSRDCGLEVDLLLSYNSNTAPLQMESILLYLLTMETILLAQLFL
jgi:hypothetical protein